VITFPLPDAAARKAILSMYAKQLSGEALAELAAKSNGFSARDLKQVCENAEQVCVVRAALAAPTQTAHAGVCRKRDSGGRHV
jgi:ATP-dependent 26S proteasome regulatory subunit